MIQKRFVGEVHDNANSRVKPCCQKNTHTHQKQHEKGEKPGAFAELGGFELSTLQQH